MGEVSVLRISICIRPFASSAIRSADHEAAREGSVVM
jgi:hypothetical protein